MRIWWLSFVDGCSLGICLVEALDIVSAIKVAHARGINPGGEVLAIESDPEVLRRLTFSLKPYMNRLIPPHEARALNARISFDLES